MRLVYYKKYLNPQLVLGGRTATGSMLSEAECNARPSDCRPYDWVMLLDDDMTMATSVVKLLDICRDKGALLCQPASYNSLRKSTHPLPGLVARSVDYVEFGQVCTKNVLLHMYIAHTRALAQAHANHPPRGGHED